ncbi:MAG TPA: DUF58 domain-containing protein [Phycisphaerae bacterium]|nr:DUF58 domain-containing protein [Phycisphaerae bacterium]
MPASSKCLNPEIIARLQGLELRARGIVAGYISGMHRSPYRGFSVEFAEHREYVPGDDLRHVDWRLFGRADRFYVKQYEVETNLRCCLLVDASESMAYGGSPVGAGPRGLKRAARPSKFDYARTLAASLAYLVIDHQDAAGLITFDSEVRDRLDCKSGKAHLANLADLLDGAAPAGKTHVKVLFHRLAEELHSRSMVVLISDLLADPDHIVAGLDHIRYAGHELIVFHVMDDDEWNFPFVENVLFDGLEEPAQLLADPQSLRDSYLAAVQRLVTRVRAACLKLRADYVLVNTSDPVDAVLCGYLGRRARSVAGAKRR